MDKPKLIYLATPYNHADPNVRRERFEAAVLSAACLMGQGFHVFCPIAHTHPIAEAGSLPSGWDYWEQYDRVMLAACSDLWVVKIEGWEGSVGIQGEIQIASELGLNIKYLEYPLNHHGDFHVGH